ncbi:MAG: peptidylprolyl isomerase [Actinomycetota bacterium]
MNRSGDRRPAAIRVVAVIVGALLATACGDAFRPPAAVVKGVEITDAQLEQAVPMFRFLAGLRQAPCGEPKAGESPDVACSRFTLGQLIEEQIVASYAEGRDLSVGRDEISSAIDPLEQQLGGRTELRKRLTSGGLTLDDLRELARRLLLVQKVAGDVAKRTVTDAELRRRYRGERIQFTVVHAAHILVRTRALAARIAAEATPQNFAALAQRYSTDRGSAAQGGDLGSTPASQLDSSFVQAALQLAPGEISGPVHTQFGWHVIELISVRRIPFEQARDQLVSEMANDVFVRWLRGEAQGDAVDVNPRFGRFDVGSGLVVGITCLADTRAACS